MKRKLVLENGMSFEGDSFGSTDEKIAELVFNTSMVGYQEILSDPSYCDQLVVMSYPLIGNYGLADEDYESKKIFMSGFIVREYNDNPSNFRATMSLSDQMIDNGVVGISGVDTRMIVRQIRDHGSMKAIITDLSVSKEECLAKLNSYELPTNQIAKVTCKKIWQSRTRNPKYSIVAVDCGIKLNIVRELNKFGCNVFVVPFDTKVEDIKKLNPDGIFISNGPGDPINALPVIEIVKAFRGIVPILGICLGHQIISLAYGAKTYKMKFGHRGANHPVKNLLTGRIEITSQNHSYAVDKNSLENTGLSLSHFNVLDNEVEGVRDAKNKVIGIQYHPESAPGPKDSEYIFAEFINLIKEAK